MKKEDTIMNGNLRNSFFISSLLIMALTFFGCSSSNDNSDNNNPPPAPTSRIAVGSMTKGSVDLNGVHYDDTQAIVTADDGSKTTAFLADGMTVKVKGTVNADGRSGVAEKVEVASEARGAIITKGTDTVEVHKQTVLIDGGTVLAGGVTGIGSLTVADNIEVHGGRDDTGVIHATRVEKLAAAGVDEVRGAVSGKTATQFNIGSLPVTFDAASTVMVPAGATFVDGDIVQVHLSGSTATRIAVEKLDEFEAAEGGELSFEGIISGYTSTTSAFKVGSQQVKLGASARIIGGVLLDLIDGMKVEAEGHTATGGILNAEKVTIKDSIRLEANAVTAGSANILGKNVTMTSGTRLDNLASGASITAGDGIQVRGFLNVNKDGGITATRVRKLSNAVDTRRFIVQGPVTSKDAATHKLVILGITVDASGASGVDDSGNAVANVDQIFSSTTAGETIIKARGIVSGTSMTADELEIE
jgi:uncharacterized protein DUF5666